MFDASPFLRTGQMTDFFQAGGIFPLLRTKLNKYVKGSVNAAAQSFNMKLGIPSAPDVKLFLDCFKAWKTSSFVTLVTAILWFVLVSIEISLESILLCGA